MLKIEKVPEINLQDRKSLGKNWGIYSRNHIIFEVELI